MPGLDFVTISDYFTATRAGFKCWPGALFVFGKDGVGLAFTRDIGEAAHRSVASTGPCIVQVGRATSFTFMSVTEPTNLQQILASSQTIQLVAVGRSWQTFLYCCVFCCWCSKTVSGAVSVAFQAPFCMAMNVILKLSPVLFSFKRLRLWMVSNLGPAAHWARDCWHQLLPIWSSSSVVTASAATCIPRCFHFSTCTSPWKRVVPFLIMDPTSE